MNHEDSCEVQQEKEIVRAVLDKFRALLFLMDKFASHRSVVMAVIDQKMKEELNAEKKKALSNALQKIADQKKREDTCEKVQLSIGMNSSKVLPFLIFAGVILAQVQGFCDDSAALKELEAKGGWVTGFLHGPLLRNIILSLAGGFGIFRTFATHSSAPLLFWGGTGLVVAFIPSLIKVLCSIG